MIDDISFLDSGRDPRFSFLANAFQKLYLFSCKSFDFLASGERKTSTEWFSLCQSHQIWDYSNKSYDLQNPTMNKFLITSIAAVSSAVVLIVGGADGLPHPEIAMVPAMVVAQAK